MLRIDKYLWCIRVYKSRTLASQACEGGKVKISGERVKPSYHVKTGDIISVQQGYIKRVYKVLGMLEKRVSAQIAVKYAEDITPEDEKLKQEIARRSYIQSYKTKGRPTKKERRVLDKVRGL